MTVLTIRIIFVFGQITELRSNSKMHHSVHPWYYVRVVAFYADTGEKSRFFHTPHAYTTPGESDPVGIFLPDLVQEIHNDYIIIIMRL